METHPRKLTKNTEVWQRTRNKKRCPEGRSGARAGKPWTDMGTSPSSETSVGSSRKCMLNLSQDTRHVSLGVLQFYCSSSLTIATRPTGETISRGILNSLVSAGSCPFDFLVFIQKKLHLKHFQTACFELLLNLIVE